MRYFISTQACEEIKKIYEILEKDSDGNET